MEKIAKQILENIDISVEPELWGLDLENILEQFEIQSWQINWDDCKLIVHNF